MIYKSKRHRIRYARLRFGIGFLLHGFVLGMLVTFLFGILAFKFVELHLFDRLIHWFSSIPVVASQGMSDLLSPFCYWLAGLIGKHQALALIEFVNGFVVCCAWFAASRQINLFFRGDKHHAN